MDLPGNSLGYHLGLSCPWALESCKWTASDYLVQNRRQENATSRGSRGGSLGLAEYLEVRADSVGVFPLNGLVEPARRINRLCRCPSSVWRLAQCDCGCLRRRRRGLLSIQPQDNLSPRRESSQLSPNPIDAPPNAEENGLSLAQRGVLF
jgi:hypothetical protein